LAAADKSFEIAAPRADAMIESLRAFGYDLETAISDLIDNSISAGAKNVWIEFTWNGTSSLLTVTDDGKGMNDEELFLAMRPGNRSPLEERTSDDLGRFGLGLKTASFSQCRSLTVISKSANCPIFVRCWDLDYVKETGEWRLLKDAELAPSDLRKRLDAFASGTTVWWQKLDRVVGLAEADDESAHRRFLDGFDRVKQHLGMVFHRFLSEPGGLKIWLNGRETKSWDPYLTNENATQILGRERLRLGGQLVDVQPYVLPHHSKVEQEIHSIGAGPRGWNAQQGFYVYRNRRLLVAGDWLGLGFQKEEHFKLARIRVDFSNAMDTEWDIDVKKSRARPPGLLRSDLKRIATATRSRASEVYRHRGKVIAREASGAHTFVWLRKVRHGKIFYEINREHPVVKELLDETSGKQGELSALLRLIEETVPVPYVVMNNAERPDSHAAPYEGVASTELAALLNLIIEALLRDGLTPLQVRERLVFLEPFSLYPEVVEAAIERIELRIRSERLRR
jgi:Histidine kinase-, DNA gyrase B-, and HSP90-like ATPase